MSNSINLAALGFGGMDTTSLVSSLVSIASQPITNLQTQQQAIQTASTSISAFSNDLSALKSATVALSDPTTFQAMAATSSDSSIVATASGSPAAGQWSVSVGNIATAQRTLSNGASSSTTALGLSGTLGISLGNGTTASINVSSSDSLTDIANAISSSGLRVQASIMYDGSQYHLLVSGLDTGSSNAVSFDESGLTAGTGGYTLGLSGTKATLQSAQDANLTVGGVAITSATNQITNAIPGVTLAITQPTTAPSTITVAGDSSGIESQVQAFVTAYNTVVADGHTIAGYGSQVAENTLLQGDQAVRSSLDQLSSLVASPVAGTTGAYTSLGSIGVSLQDDGTLAFNTSQFETAMQSDPASVTRLFVTDASNGSTGIMGTFGTTIDSLTDPTDGAVTAELNGFNDTTQRISNEITDDQQRVTAYQTQLTTEFANMNAALATYKQLGNSLTAAFNTGNNSSSGSVL
jgi:flagellar hook-associated protein 2